VAAAAAVVEVAPGEVAAEADEAVGVVAAAVAAAAREAAVVTWTASACSFPVLLAVSDTKQTKNAICGKLFSFIFFVSL
jgi:hypothetical protein